MTLFEVYAWVVGFLVVNHIVGASVLHWMDTKYCGGPGGSLFRWYASAPGSGFVHMAVLQLWAVVAYREWRKAKS